MDVASTEEGSEVKAESASDDDVTVLEDEEEIRDGRNEDGVSSGGKASGPDFVVQDAVMEAETSHGDSSQDSHPVDEKGATLYPLDQGTDQGWVWNRDSEVQHGSKEMTRRGASAVRRFQCGICGTTFTLLKNAQRHYRCKHLNYFYWCKYCPNGKQSRRYTRREFLDDHFMSHHPGVMCEVSEVKGMIPPDQFDILPVYVDEEVSEEEDGSTDLVTTSDLGAQERSDILEDSPRSAMDSQLCLDQGGQTGMKHADGAPRGQFIDLSDFRGYANDSNVSMGPSAGPSRCSSKRNCPPSMAITQSSKQTRLENRMSARESDVLLAAETLFGRGEGPNRQDKAPHVVNDNFSQATMNPGNSFPNQTSASSSYRNALADGAPNPSTLFHPSSAFTQDCLVIGSAIPQPMRDDKAPDTISPVTTSSPTASEVLEIPNQTSQQVAISSTRQGRMQPAPFAEIVRDQQRAQTGYGRRATLLPSRSNHTEQSSLETGGVVNSSSDTRSKRASKSRRRSQEIVLSGEGAPAQSSLSCREILLKYQERISKYSKEIDYRYSSDGTRVRKKTVKHVFVFNRGGENGEQSSGDTEYMEKANKSAS